VLVLLAELPFVIQFEAPAVPVALTDKLPSVTEECRVVKASTNKFTKKSYSKLPEDDVMFGADIR